MEEIWKRIPNYSKYEASNLGRIKTFNWKNKGIERVMKPALDPNGYYRTVLIRDDGKYTTVKVHRIICQTFLDNPENKPAVNHKNFVRSDNRLENLEWCTFKENTIHSFENERRKYKGGSSCAALTDEQVLEIRANYEPDRKVKGRKTKRQIAEEYNTTFYVIKMIIQKQNYRHLL